MSLLAVEDARRLLLDGAELQLPECVELSDALGRTLAEDVLAERDQPPFPASAMDGYAVRSADLSGGETRMRLVGTSRAGEAFSGRVGAGEAVRVFTGAPVPPGADCVVIQENATARGMEVVLRDPPARGRYVRPPGLDYRAGEVLLRAGTHLNPMQVALCASAGRRILRCRAKPSVAILSTGDELVPPGVEPRTDQIHSSNNAGLAAAVARAGGVPVDLGIAPDDSHDIGARLAGVEADILVTIGGASVGEHDLVREALARIGGTLDAWRIAMRPGKPLMIGRHDGRRVLGLPGNPVSALVCATLFLAPLVRVMLGSTPGPEEETGRLARELPANDQRQDYLRSRISVEDGCTFLHPFERQDSSMLGTLAVSDALVVRAPHAPKAEAGDLCRYLALDK